LHGIVKNIPFNRQGATEPRTLCSTESEKEETYQKAHSVRGWHFCSRRFALDHDWNLFYIQGRSFDKEGVSDTVDVVAALCEWGRNHSQILWGVSAVSLITFIGTVAVLPLLVARIPDDYFVRSRKVSLREQSHPLSRLLCLIVKNLAGIVFIIAGVVMLFIPGQGILTILIGVMLMNFPGKRRIALRIARQPTVLRAVNWMRVRSRRPPLVVPQSDLMNDG
jgi:hypothetical protein